MDGKERARQVITVTNVLVLCLLRWHIYLNLSHPVQGFLFNNLSLSRKSQKFIQYSISEYQISLVLYV